MCLEYSLALLQRVCHGQSQGFSASCVLNLVATHWCAFGRSWESSLGPLLSDILSEVMERIIRSVQHLLFFLPINLGCVKKWVKDPCLEQKEKSFVLNGYIFLETSREFLHWQGYWVYTWNCFFLKHLHMKLTMSLSSELVTLNYLVCYGICQRV